VPVLVKAVQEQQAQKDAEIAALKAQNADLQPGSPDWKPRAALASGVVK